MPIGVVTSTFGVTGHTGDVSARSLDTFAEGNEDGNEPKLFVLVEGIAGEDGVPVKGLLEPSTLPKDLLAGCPEDIDSVEEVEDKDNDRFNCGATLALRSFTFSEMLFPITPGRLGDE